MQMPQWVTLTTLLTLHIGRLQQEGLHAVPERGEDERRVVCSVLPTTSEALQRLASHVRQPISDSKLMSGPVLSIKPFLKYSQKCDRCDISATLTCDPQNILQHLQAMWSNSLNVILCLKE